MFFIQLLYLICQLFNHPLIKFICPIFSTLLLKQNQEYSHGRVYGIAFNMFSPIHDKKRTQNLQNCISAQSGKSHSSAGNMRAIVRGMWKYAIMNKYCEYDITEHLIFEFTETEVSIHTRFTNVEVNKIPVLFLSLASIHLLKNNLI